jgi:hypothetical protein
MGWQTPKTNWDSLYIPGAGDFNRIEENEQWLKEERDRGPFFIMPSDTLILRLDEARYTNSTFPVIVKRFRLKYAGIYRVTFELTGTGVGFIGNCQRIAQSISKWDSFSIDMFFPPGISEVALQAQTQGVTFAIRRVRLHGTLMRYADTPGNAVLQN